MKGYEHPQRNAGDLLRDAAAHAAQERDGRDLLVVDIAEIDARRVYRQAGYPSTVVYCMEALGLSRKAALHRIHVGRVAWRFPAILAGLRERRVHITAVSLLAAHVTEDNVDELLEKAAGKNVKELRELIATRFPRQDLFTTGRLAEPLLPTPGPSLVESAPAFSTFDDCSLPDSPAAETHAERRLNGVVVPERPIEMPPERFPLKLALERKTHEKLSQARDLLGHQIPSGDLAEVLDRVLDAFIAQAEKRKFAATSQPRVRRVPTPPEGRYIPAEVKRAVVKRDGRQCTFVTPDGRRCPARGMLEFDHILEVARGGPSTVENLRLRCRAHNQYTAEQSYGAEFIQAKIEESRGAGARKESEEALVPLRE